MSEPKTQAPILFRGGPTGVLLIHGLGGTPAEMKALGRWLADADTTVLCCQLAGHCGSEDDLLATTWRDWYASAEAALGRLEQSCDRVIVGGLSMGAVLAARLAAREPNRVTGLIMLAPTLRCDGWSTPWYRGLLQPFVATPLGSRWRFVEQQPFGVKDERIRALVARAMFSGRSEEAGLPATPGRSIRELGRLVAAVRSDLASVRQRTLLVHAREDDMADLSNAFYLQRHLGGLVEAMILDDSYHLVTVDRQRGLVMERVADFVRSFAETPSEHRPVRNTERLHVA